MIKEHEQLIDRVKIILSKPLEYYTSSNIESIKGLMEAMEAISIEDKPMSNKEDDLMELMFLVQQSKSFTIKQLSSHMWITVGQYYMFLQDLQNNNYKDIHLFGK